MDSVLDMYHELVGRAATMDWYYSYSDDARVWKAGKEAHENFKLRLLALQALNPELAEKIREIVPVKI